MSRDWGSIARWLIAVSFEKNAFLYCERLFLREGRVGCKLPTFRPQSTSCPLHRSHVELIRCHWYLGLYHCPSCEESKPFDEGVCLATRFSIWSEAQSFCKHFIIHRDALTTAKSQFSGNTCTYSPCNVGISGQSFHRVVLYFTLQRMNKVRLSSATRALGTEVWR